MPARLLSVASALALAVLFTQLPGEPAGADTSREAVEAFKRFFPQSPVSSVRETPLPGIYEIVSGSELVYMSGDGKFMFTGSLWDASKRINLAERTKQRLRRRALKRVAKDQVVSYVPDNPRHAVTVFTDVDCGYCRKFHSHMAELLEQGVRVNYLLLPLQGPQAREKAVGVWCADNRNAAMDRAKAGKHVPMKKCDTPIAAHERAAREIGVRGTPAIVLDSGALVSGYVPPGRLLEILVSEAR